MPSGIVILSNTYEFLEIPFHLCMNSLKSLVRCNVGAIPRKWDVKNYAIIVN
jgi:hypothetical protein